MDGASVYNKVDGGRSGVPAIVVVGYDHKHMSSVGPLKHETTYATDE